LDYFGLLWITLDYFGLLWITLDSARFGGHFSISHLGFSISTGGGCVKFTRAPNAIFVRKAHVQLPATNCNYLRILRSKPPGLGPFMHLFALVGTP
jgi:hypothetical protein